MPLFTRHISRRRITVFGIEAVLIPLTVVAAALVHGHLDEAMDGIWRIALITVVCELFFYWNDLYDLTVVEDAGELVIRIMQSAGAAAIAIAAASAVLPSLLIADGVLLTSLVLLLIVLPGWRLAAQVVTQGRGLEERVLIIGTGNTARALAAEIQKQHDFSYRVIGFAGEPSLDAGPLTELPIIGSTLNLDQLVAAETVDRIVVSLPDRRGTLPLKQLLQAKLSGVQVEDAGTIYERLTGKILLDDLKPSWLIFSDGFRASRTTRALKRSLDIICAATGLLLASPLAALTVIAIRLDSSGPVLYRQERAGLRGRPFTLYKFRSMRIDAEGGTPIWARDHDDRVTGVGRFLRLSRLDEIPQLWNVLKGDMSLVGPRPERPFFVEQLADQIPFYMERHSVRPGVTGWAQVRYRYGASIEETIEKLQYDLYYIKHQSIAFDLAIAVDTVKVILVGKGAK
jgi:sugar transferase (PEP-CTERM system associated)